MTNQTYIPTGLAGFAQAGRLRMPVFGRLRMDVTVKHDATAPSLAVRRKS